MFYPPEAVEAFERNHAAIQQELLAAYFGAVVFADRLTNPEAAGYMRHGVSRRLGLIRKSASNIFDLFPPSRTKPLSRESLEDITINLHAFVLHVNALQDNLAWAYQLEFGMGLPRMHVSLFRDELMLRLPQPVQEYLTGSGIADWHKEYSTDFRDALAHRIPLYVPPSQLTAEEIKRSNELQTIFNDRVTAHDWDGVEAAQAEMNALGQACPQFLHCVTTSKPVILHPQILADARTAIALYEIMAANWAEPFTVAQKKSPEIASQGS